MPSRRISEVIGDRAFPCVTGDASVQDVAILMKDLHTSAVLVVENNTLLGICTGRDMIHHVVVPACDSCQVPVREIMTRAVQTIFQHISFGHALHMMYQGGFRHLPVLDEDGHPVGLLTAHDALDADGLQMEEELIRREDISVIL